MTRRNLLAAAEALCWAATVLCFILSIMLLSLGNPGRTADMCLYGMMLFVAFAALCSTPAR